MKRLIFEHDAFHLKATAFAADPYAKDVTRINRSFEIVVSVAVVVVCYVCKYVWYVSMHDGIKGEFRRTRTMPTI